MGVVSFFSSCSCNRSWRQRLQDRWDDTFDYTSKRAKKRARQKKNKLVKQVTTPDPSKFEILEVYHHEGWAALRVKYEEATNYEGIKILVVKASVDDLIKMKKLDPHFCEEDHIKPFARFEPTERGWYEAKNLLVTLAVGDEVSSSTD